MRLISLMRRPHWGPF